MFKICQRNPLDRSALLAVSWMAVATGIALIASTPAWSADKSWNSGGVGTWSQDAKWTPAGTPGAADMARLGDLPAANGALVSLDQDAEVAGLALSGGVSLNANGNQMRVGGDVTLSGFGSSIFIPNSAHEVDFEAGNVTVNANASFDLGGGTAKIHGLLDLNSEESGISGGGEIQFTGTGTTFSNSGFDWFVNSSLKLVQQGDGLFDLDGNASGNVEIFIQDGATLTFEGSGLTDSVNNALVALQAGTTLDMKLASPWSFESSNLHITNPTAVATPARLTGADVNLPDTHIEVGVGEALEIDANATVSGNAFLQAGGRLDFLKDATLLGQTTIWGPVVFHGQTEVNLQSNLNSHGTLINTQTGEMRIADGAALGPVAIENHGLLEIGNSPGMASVDGFLNDATGIWRVEIGGHTAGTEHDLLLVADEAILGGTLEVELIDLGSGLFLPQIGDEFTILTAGGSLSGAFLADPISYAAGRYYHWSVLTDLDEVTLRLNAITVPEPSTYLLLVLGMASLLVVRRRNRKK